MKMDPADAAAPFNLGNVLRASGRAVEAEAAYRAAVKADPAFALAWYNLADLLDDARRTKEAVACLERALDADPAYTDAMFNMGLFLQRLEQHARGGGVVAALSRGRRQLALGRPRQARAEILRDASCRLADLNVALRRKRTRRLKRASSKRALRALEG